MARVTTVRELHLSMHFFFYNVDTIRVDNFLDRLLSYRRENNLPRPLLVGLALSDQIVDEVPVEPHDK